MKNTIALLAFMVCTMMWTERCHAQAVKINFDLKVIYTDSLNMPDNSIAEYLLNILPDMLERPGDALINEYDIQIEDMSVGSIMDGVLTQLRLADIEKIEVNESPLSTYMNNGQSGSINIFLKQRPNKDNGMWGSVSMDAHAPMNIYPKLTLGYKNNKFMVRAFAFGDIYNATYDTENALYQNGRLVGHSTMSEKDKFWSNMVRVYMQYKPDAANEFNLKVSQVSTKDDATSITDGDNNSKETLVAKSTILRALAKYTHQFGQKGKLTAELQYIYEPSNKEQGGTNFLEADNNKHTLAGKVEYKHLLTAAGMKKTSWLTLGVNGNYSYTNDAKTARSNTAWLDIDPIPTYVSSYHDGTYTPYLRSENSLGRFRLKAEAQLQVKSYNIAMHTQDNYKKTKTDVLGKIMSEWHFNSNDFMRLILDRKLILPSNGQIFPFMYLDPASMKAVFGNDELKNTMSHEVKGEYFNYMKWGGHSLQLNVGLSYNNIRNIITSVTESKELEYGGGTMPYTTYINNGKSDLFNATIMALYTYKVLSLSLAGNFFHNHKEVNNVTNHHRYFNIMLMPSFHTTDGWEGALRLNYFSKVDEEYITLGDCTTASFNFGKNWGRWNAHIYGSLALSGKTTNTVYPIEKEYSTETFYLGKNIIGAGIIYRF